MVYYLSFESSKISSQKNGNTQAQIQNLGNNETDIDNTMVVDANKGAVVRTDSKTVYVEESYDIADAIYSDKESTIPPEYIGLTRVELQDKLLQYMKEPPQEELTKGLVNITLSSFSQASITVRKIYDNKEHYAHFLTEYGGYVVVYTNDKKTLVDQTGILFSDLTEEEQKEVRNGVYLDDLDQLYGLLESYTS